MTDRYPRYRVRITDPDGIHFVQGWCAFNSRHSYDQWSKRVGTDVYRVELLGIDATGNEHVMQNCELRTDLYAGVQPEPREQAEQMRLM